MINEIYDLDIILKQRQIRCISKKTENEIFGLQTSELINYIENTNGIHCTMEDKNEVNKKLERVAVLSFTPEDIGNLRKYGNVIFFNGINIHYKLL